MKPRPVLHVLIGPPGAGKSTYARQTFPQDWIVCADDVRESMSRWRRDDPGASWKYVASVKRHITDAIVAALRKRLSAGLPVVYDNTNLKARNRESLLCVAGATPEVRYVVLDRPLEAKLIDRGWRPERLIREQHLLFQQELAAILAGDGRAFITVEDRRVLA